ncbi:GAF domain-containing protein [Streptomyces albiaxialis]|uniref:GAF domain-containing protein n=1 Tax=Streptomyces albiaxialis TaxID=329523 RepID=A0ABN2VKC3_9ACTN
MPPKLRVTEAARLATTDLETLSRDSAERLPKLLEAMVTIGTGPGPDLHSTLDHIVETAVRVVDCRYAAIGVLAEEDDTGLKDFITSGMSEEEIARIPHLPDGKHGLLAAVLRTDEPLRLPDLALDPRFEGFPAHHPPMHSFLGIPIKVGDELFGNLYLTEKRGPGGFTENDVQLLRILATEAGIAIGNARLREAARIRERWIDGSAAITTALLAGDTDDALAVVAEQARMLAGASAGLVLLPTSLPGDPADDHGERRGLEIVAAAADDTRGLVGTVIPPESPVLDQLLGGSPVFVDDSAEDPRMVTPISARFGPSMMLPLESGGRVLGTLAVPRRRGAPRFTEAEKSLATRFAAQAALALVMADALHDRERLAVYEDRDRIARDLHDLVIQRLFATGMTLQGAQRSAEKPEVRQRISKAVDELDATIAEIRTAIFALQQDPGEAQAGLRTRVLREAGLAAVPLGFQPSVHFVGAVDARVSERTTKNLVAALREALSNAFRHAQASRIEITVDATAVLPDGEPGVRLTVADDGVGIPADGRRSGLANLRRRAESLGGTAGWGPGLASGGGGTTVNWAAPL